MHFYPYTVRLPLFRQLVDGLVPTQYTTLSGVRIEVFDFGSFYPILIFTQVLDIRLRVNGYVLAISYFNLVNLGRFPNIPEIRWHRFYTIPLQPFTKAIR